jgi:hypothetical protein
MENEWLTTLEASFRYVVGGDMLKTWRRWRGFPEDAVRAVGRTLEWHEPTVTAWLRSRPVYKNGPQPRWLEVVGHPAARGEATAKARVHPQP